MEDHPSSAVRGCLFNLFTATLHIGGRSSIRNLRTRHAVVTGTHIHGNSDLEIKFSRNFNSYVYVNINMIMFALLSDPMQWRIMNRMSGLAGRYTVLNRARTYGSGYSPLILRTNMYT